MVAHFVGCLVVTYMLRDWGARGASDGGLGQGETYQWVRTSGKAKTARTLGQHAAHRNGRVLLVIVRTGYGLANITRQLKLQGLGC